MIYRWIGNYTALMEKYLDERTNGGIRDRDGYARVTAKRQPDIDRLFQYRSRAKTLKWLTRIQRVS
jgi:hypothetical protein